MIRYKMGAKFMIRKLPGLDPGSIRKQENITSSWTPDQVRGDTLMRNFHATFIPT